MLKKFKKEPGEYHATEDIRTRFGKLLFSDELSDVILSIGPQQELVHAHRLVLSSASEPLQKMLLGNHSEAKSSTLDFRRMTLHTRGEAGHSGHETGVGIGQAQDRKGHVLTLS